MKFEIFLPGTRLANSTTRWIDGVICVANADQVAIRRASSALLLLPPGGSLFPPSSITCRVMHGKHLAICSKTKEFENYDDC